MIIFFLCLFICAEAQNTTNQNNDEQVQPLHPSMVVSLTVLLIMFLLTFAIVGFARFCQRRESGTSEVESNANGILRSRSRFSGLDRTTVESLPFFRFSSLKGSKEGLECAVCLSRFEGDEVLRMLPKCRHAFHVECIDTWLVAHSSCPICRNRLNAIDIRTEGSTNLEFFIQREEKQGKTETPLIQDSVLHKFKHRIIVSDVMHKSRWSDVNSSDMISLSSEMMNAMSRKVLSSEISPKDQILKIKEDMERKRVYEAKNGNGSGDICESSVMSKSLDPSQKRSMSEIINISRFTLNKSSRRIDGSSTQVNKEKDEEVRRVWLPIVRRTISWFSVQETSSDAGKKRATCLNFASCR